MVSKNNLHLKQTKMADQTPHYGLRKLSVGVASVLLSTTLYLGVTAQADTLPTGDESQSPATSAVADSSSSSAGTLTIAQSAGSTADTQETTDSTASQASSTATSQSSESAVSASPVSESVTNDQNTSASPVASSADQTAEPAVNTVSVSDLATMMLDLSPSSADLVTDSALTTSLVTSTTAETPDVSKWGYKVVPNGTANEIVLTGYTGTGSTIIVPNAVDFANAGVSISNSTVYLTYDLAKKIAATSGVTKLIISNNGGAKVVACGNSISADSLIIGNADWSQAFENTSLSSMDLRGLDTSQITDMQLMFYACNNLTSLDASNWDTSKVTNMQWMFTYCNNLTSLDVSNWDTSKITDMYNMFYACNNLTSLDVSKWNTSNVIEMGGMFTYCNNFTSLDVSNWDTSKVTDMNGMFMGCDNLTSLDVSNWDTSNVTDMNYMFENCSHLTSLDVSNWDVSKVESMNSMFYGCSNLTSLDVSKWNTSNVTDMSKMLHTDSYVPLEVITKDSKLLAYDYVSDRRVSKLRFKADADDATLNSNNAQTDSKILTVAYTPEQAKNSTLTSKIDQLANDSTSNYQQLAKTYQATIKANPGLSAELAAAFDAVSNESATRPNYDFIAFNPDGVTLGQSATPAELLNGTYNAEWKEKAKTTVEFVDDDNNGAVVGTPTVLNGYVGDVDAVSMTLPANYELVSGQTIPTSVTLNAADDTIQIHLKHQIQNIADDDPMNHTSFQVTVHYKKGDATNTFMPDTVITTKYKRTTTKDLVTGKYTATPFVLESISQTGTKIDGLGTPAEGVVKDVPAGWQYFTYSIPYNVSVPGWHQSRSGSLFTDAIGIAAGTSTAMKTAELTAIYAANTQTTHIKYVNANGTVVKTDTISGKTDTTQTVNSTVPTGWKMTTPQTIPTSVTFDGDGVPDTTITIEHDHVAVTHDNPQTTGTQIPNGAAKFKGVANSDLNKTVTRTVTITSPNGKAKTTTQTFTSTRDAVVDMVDGSVVYGKWTKGQWDAIDVPAIEHYTVSQTSVPEQTVDGSMSDTTVNVTYTANAETVTVQWVDDTENGKVVYSTNVSLQPGKKTDVWIFGLDETGHASMDAVKLRDMYDLVGVSDADVLQPWLWGKSYYDVFNLVMPSVDNWIDGNTYTAYLTHKISATDGYSSPTNIALRTTNSKRYPNLMYTDDAALSKTHKDVTRTITIVKSDGSQSTTTQKLAFSRQAQYDMVTGEFKGYTDWKEGTQTFAAYTPNAIDGYTAETAPRATATGDSDNSAITLHYTANPQTAKIVYADKDGNTVKTDTVNGVTDQTVDTNSTVPTGWKLVDGQTIPATIKLSANTPDTKITVEHNHVTITPDNPQVDDTDIPNGVAKFKGVSDNDLNQTLTRTITVNDPHTGAKAITQTAKISRNATVDMVDGSAVYGDWSTAEWPEYVVPTVDGYTPSQKIVEAKAVVNGDKDDNVTVNYTADKQTAKIVYTDADDNPVKTDTVEGVTDQTVDTNSTVPTGWKLVDGQTIPATIKLGVNTPDTKVIIEHDHVTIASGKPQADGTQIPNGIAKFKGVSDSDLNKTVTRMVTITSPDGTAKITKQTFTSTRDAVVDMVDGSVVYGNWTKGQWDAVDVPAIEHYTASQTSVPEQTVDGSTADATVNVTYTVNDETVTVQWIDDETGETLYSEAVTAKPNVTKIVYAYGVDSNGKTSDDMLYLQGCYELVSVSDTSVLTLYNSTMSRYFDAYKVVFPSVDNWIDGNTYSVHLKHHVVTVKGMDNPTSEAFRNTNTARYPKLMFTEDVATNKTNHTVMRTIILHQPSGDKTVIQSTDFERGANYDAVNGKFLGYTDWRGWPTTLSSYEVPTVAGYTASIQEVPSLEINGDSADQAVEVNYTANAQTTHVVYVNQNGKQIQSDDVDGHTDETVKVTSKVPAGWVPVDGRSMPESITFGVSTPDVKVVVKHGHVVVTPDAPKTSNDKLPDNSAQNYPTGVDHDNLNKTVTRTINVHNLDGTVTPIVQTAHLTRTADVDEVDGTVTYGEWTTGSWDKFVSTLIDGYTASLTEMPVTEVSSATADTSFDVIYMANSQSMRINYIDESGQTVGSTIVNGHTDETVTTNSKVPVGWKLIDGQNVPTEITFKGAKTDDVTVKVEHAHVTVQPSDPKTFADKLPDNADKNYPSGVGYDDLNKTITRTIEIDEPNGNIIFVPKQEVHYTRTADVDEVNGTVTYGEWTTKDQFAEFANVPVFAGYTPSQDKVDAAVPSVDDNNSAVKITYTANEQSMQIVYVDENGQTVKADTVKGHTDETVPTNSTVPAGWTTENTVPAEITFKGAKTADVTIKVKHAHVTVTPDKPETANDKLPDNTDKNYPSGVDHDDLNKTVKRTINVYNVDGTTTTVEQEVHFTRTADVDEVDGTVEYGSWQANKQFDQYAVPVVLGYVSVIDGKEQSTIQPAMPNVDDNDSTIDVTYQAVDGSQTIDYVDENDTVIGYQIITGKTAETKPVKSAVPVGWKLADDQTVPATVTIKADDVPIKVLVEHDHVAVSHDNAQKDGTRIPNGVSVFNGVTDDDLNQTLTRTITVNDPHAGAKAITQTAKIYRDAVVDMVDGSVVYGKWSTAEWPAYTVPTVDGYTPSQTTVETKTVANGDQDDAVTIDYTADKQTAKIVYTDANDNPVKTDTIDGVTDQTVDTNSTVPTGWKLIDGQTIPVTIKLGVNTPDTIVKVEHDHVSVNHDNPQTDGTQIPNGVARFKGVNDNDLNQTLTRTITINDPHNGAKAITQTAKIYRDAIVDMVDGSVVYGDWSTAEWPEYSVPTVDGYTPSQKTVEAKTVIDGTKDDNATIDYTANAQTAKIVYIDADNKPVKTDTIDGVTDQTVDTNSTVPTGWKLIDGQTIPAMIKLGVNTPDTIVKVEHDHVSVNHDNSQTDGTQIPNGVAKFKGVSDSNLNQTLTRTITVNDPHAGAKTVTQTVKISRDATVDMVDGSVVYGEWSTAQWPEYSVPAVDGYTPSQKTVEAKTVIDGTKDDNVTIDYTADKQTAKIVYTDADNNSVKTDTVDGVTDQTIDTNSTVPTGWKLVDGQTIPTTIKLGVNTPDTVVKVEHNHVSVSHDNPQTDGTDIPGGAAQFKGVSDSDLNQTLTRTITINDPHAGVKTVAQTAKISRDATVDMVDGSVVYSDWSTAQWLEYSVPTVDGYTPSQKTVEVKAVIDGTKNDNVTIDYTANAQTAKIVYTDADDNPVKTDTVDGVTDQTVDTNSTVPTGWKLVDGQTIPTTIKLGVNTPDTVVRVEHNHVSVNHDNPQTDDTQIPNGVAQFKGVSDSDLNQTLTRTITVNDPHTGAKTITQTAKISRDATVDMVDGSVVYGDWSTAEWPEYSVPAVDGYTPSQETVEAKTVIDGTKDDNVTIDYTADKQTAKIVYTDADNNLVKTDTVNGVTDQTVDTNSTMPTGWKLADGQTIPTTIKLGANTPDTVVKVEHDHVSVNHDNPQTDGTDIPNGAAQFKGVSDSDLNQTLTRTITVNDPHEGVKTIMQTAKISRDATVDMVDGSVVYGKWSTAEWPEYSAPTVDGYTPSQATVEAKTVIDGTKDDNATINYTADKQTTNVVYVDENGDQIKSDAVNGVTDQTVKVVSNVPAGWKLVDGQSVLTEITFKGAKTADAEVKVEHAHVTVTPDAPKTSTDKLPDNADKSYPNGVDHDDLNKTVKRTINVHNVDGTTTTVEQDVHFTRTADVDEADGTVVYGNWQANKQFDQYVVSVIPGYVSMIDGKEQSTIQPVMPSVDDNDSTIEVSYQAVDGSQTIDYVDENDTVISYQIITGKTAEIKPVKSAVPVGWKLADGQTVPAMVAIKANDVPIKVLVEHDHVAVSHDNPQANGTKIPNGVSVFNGVTDDDLNQTLTRTITVNDPHTGVKTVAQTAKISRDATVDMVDGSVVYGKWSTAEWPAYIVPTVDGYTSSQKTVEAKTVADGDQDDAVAIDYTADKQTAEIVYTDADGNLVKTDTVNGVTDQTVGVNSTVPIGWKLADGQTIPATIKLGVNTPDTIVKVEHNHVSINHNNPQIDGTDISNGVTKFKGVSDNDLNQTLTRTITINDPHNGAKTITQTAKIYRDAVVDMVDGSVAYGDWSTAEWPEYSVPTVDGYTPSQKTVEAKTVADGDQDDAVAVDYTADKQTAKIVYTDADNNPVKTDTVEGVTDQTVDTNSTVPTGWKLVDGQMVPATIKLGANTPDTVVKVEHDHVSISHDNPQTDGTDIPNGATQFKGVADNDLNQTLTRTITINDPHAGVKTVAQTAKISRDATVDMVDGSVVYGDWSTAEWSEYSVPAVDGYTSSQTTVEAKTVANGDQDDAVTIDYTANKQTAKIVYVDENDNPVKTDTVDGVTDQTVDANSTVPTGWKLVDGQTIPATIKLGVNTPDTIVKVEHDHVSISHDNPQADGIGIPGGTAKFSGVDDNDLNQTLTRTITINDPHAGAKTVTQTTKISRNATVDMVDGSVVYSDWSTAQWPEYSVPTVDGYTSSQKTVEAKTVANGDKDDAVAVNYTADKQMAKIVYMDENDQPVKTDTVEGVTDQTVDANSTVPTGWKLVDGQTVPATVKLGVNTPDTIVKVEHDHVSVSHDNPQTDGTDIPGGAVKFSGVADNDLNQTLIRTITVNDPHTGVKTVTQTAKIYRDAVVDMVDGSVAYGDWSTAEWPEYSAPTVDGYTPSQKTIEAKTVVDGDQNDVATIDYTADKQTAKIVYMDENDQPVKTDTVEGVTDQTVDANSTVPTGWKLVDGQMIPVTIKLGANTPDAIVKVEHDHVSISHDNPQTDGTDIPGGTAKFSGVADNDLNQTLTRTITVNDPHIGVKTVTQTAKISRDATVDMVNGSAVYGDWSTAQWPEYSVPTVDGYTPSQRTVEAKTVVNGDQDDVVTIDYTADKQMAKIVYTDENGNPVKTDTVDGVTDQTVDANSSVPTGWKLVDGQTIPVTIKLGVNTPDTVVKVEHDHVSISHNNPQTDGADIPNGAAQFKGVSDSDLNQTLTRTITVNDPHVGVKTITQTAKISRDATVDMVDGSVVYSDWSTAEWPEYSVPTIDGYTPSQKTVETKAVIDGTKDDNVTINYTADKQTAKIVYADENGNPVKTDTVDGVTDQTVDTNSAVPTGWKLIDGQTIPATIKLGVNTPDTIVKVEHDHVSISHNNPQIDGTDIPNGVAKFKGVSDSDLNQTLTRTITVNDPHAGTKTITQTAKISRNATVDMVDGSVVYGEWSTAEWPEYSAPTVDGYTPSQATVEAKTIADGDEDDAVTIDYTANAQTAKIVYTDADDNPVKTDTVDGVTDQTVDVNSTVPTGWKLADGQTIPVTIKLGVNTPDTIVKVEHDHVSVSHSNPQTDGTDIPNGAAQFKGVSDSDLNQTLTRTITVNDPHAGVKTIIQTAKISRNATVDMVDGSVAYSDWSTAEWPEYFVPTVDGYTPSQKTVEAKTVADGDQDDAVTIDYTADKQTAKIVYTDENDNPVKTDTVDGVTDQTVDANSTVPTGWKLIDGQMIPTTIKLGVNTPDVIVKVEHDHVSVSHDNPQTDGTDIPGGTAKFNGVADNDLNQTLTRTITINDPHQGAKTITQTAKVSRDATVDMVDGSVKYGDWSTAEWPEYSVPTVDGYTPSQATVEAKTVTNGDQDDVATINYTADKQTAKIVYVDENGNPVKTDTADGVTDQTVDANSTVPTGWKLVDGQMIPVTIKLGANTPDAIVKVEHDHVSISHDNSQIDGTDIPGGAAKFSGVADNDLNQTLTRTITINDPHDGVKAIAQTAQIHRDATVDMVDGSVVYGDWSTTEWPACFVPTVDGYTPSQATIEKKSVTNGDQDDAVTIDYKANAQTAKIVYTDENDQPVKTDTVDGVTDQTVDTNSTVPTGWKLVDGQTVPTTIKLGANTPDTVVKVEHDHVTITFNNPQTNGTDIPGGTAKFSGVDNSDLNQTLTRTITINDPHEGVKTITQTAKISRDATVDMVDGSVKYGDWSTAEWPAYSVPTVDGYAPSQKTVEAKAVVDGDQDDVATINYTADKQTAKIIYTDENDNPVKTDTVDGVTDQTVDTNSAVPTGWKLVDGQTIPTTIKLGVATPDTIVKVEHDYVTITSNKPQTDGTNIPGGTAKFSGVDNDDLNRTLTRTITINDPHEGIKMITQTAQIHRDAMVDMVDGSVVYGDWSTAEWPAYSVPAVDGYTPSQTTIEAKTVVDGDQDDVATINYTADKQTAKIVYVDENGNPVKTDTVEGVTDQIVDANSTIPTGWKSVDGQTIPVTIKLGVNTPDAVVKVEHDHVMITSNNPQADGTDIPGGTTKFSGVADGDLNQTLIRTIIVKLPNGQTKALAQTVKISRDATVDMVDGSVVYGDWSTAEWSEYSVPTIAGYTPSQKTVETKTVANGDKDNAVTINYRANRGTQTINYVDENGNPVVKQTLHGNVVVKQIIHGKTDQEIAVNHDKLFGWVLEDGQTVPTTVKIKAVDEPITIKLKHGIVMVTPDAPKTEFDRMPDWTDKDYPAGVGYNDLNKTVMRTITFELPDDQTKTVKQTTTFTRHATVDEVTDAVAYSNWSEQSHTFDAVDVPGVDGWTPSVEQIADITVTPDSKDEQVTVAYTANPKAPAEKVNQTDEVKSSESAPTAGVKEVSTGTVSTNEAVETENNVKADSQAKTAELPQTGNEQTGLQAAAGLALTGLAAMLGLGRKKRKND